MSQHAVRRRVARDIYRRRIPPPFLKEIDVVTIAKTLGHHLPDEDKLNPNITFKKFKEYLEGEKTSGPDIYGECSFCGENVRDSDDFVRLGKKFVHENCILELKDLIENIEQRRKDRKENEID